MKFKAICNGSNDQKQKRRGTHLKAFEVLVYRATIREPTPRS